MATIFVKQRKKQKYLIGVLVLVALVTVGVWYFGFFKKEKPPAPVSAPPRNIVINFDVLEKLKTMNLQPFQEIPVYTGSVGKINPFLP